jgi:hypothetical protein
MLQCRCGFHARDTDQRGEPVEQATIQHGGETLRRWYVYETDGRRRVTWAPTADAALAKAERSITAALSGRVEPAPPMVEEGRYD